MLTRCQKRCYLDQGRLRDVEVLLQEGVCVCVFSGAWIFLINQETQICDSNTVEVPSYFFLALAGSIRVHNNNLLEVRSWAPVHSFVRLFIHSFIGGYAAS